MLKGDLLPIVQLRKLSRGKREELISGHTVAVRGRKVKMALKTRQTRPFLVSSSPTLRKVLDHCLAFLVVLSSESSKTVCGESIL